MNRQEGKILNCFPFFTHTVYHPALRVTAKGFGKRDALSGAEKETEAELWQ